MLFRCVTYLLYPHKKNLVMTWPSYETACVLNQFN